MAALIPAQKMSRRHTGEIRVNNLGLQQSINAVQQLLHCSMTSLILLSGAAKRLPTDSTERDR